MIRFRVIIAAALGLAGCAARPDLAACSGPVFALPGPAITEPRPVVSAPMPSAPAPIVAPVLPAAPPPAPMQRTEAVPVQTIAGAQ